MAGTKRHGRNGALYIGATNGGAAVALNGKTKWSLSQSVDQVDATSFGDSSKTYLAGLPDGSADFEGFYDFAADAIFTAAADGLARNFYLYPDVSNHPTLYFFGTAFVDASMDVSVTDAVKVKGSLKAATPIQRNLIV